MQPFVAFSFLKLQVVARGRTSKELSYY